MVIRDEERLSATWPDGFAEMPDFQRRAGGRSLFGTSIHTTSQKYSTLDVLSSQFHADSDIKSHNQLYTSYLQMSKLMTFL